MINNNRLIKTFLELIAIDSPSGEEGNITREIEKRLKALGGKVKFDSFGNLIVRFIGKGEPLMLNAHLDTVEPGRGIKPKVSRNIIKTNGTTILGADNKAGVALILEALITAKEKRVETLPIEVVMTLGEEAGLLGAINLDYGNITAKQGVTFDGHADVGNINISAPGYYRVDVTVIGRSAHAGVEPEKGISAIEIVSKIISSLRLGRIDEETTANVGLIEGGSARNAVAEKANFKAEIRSRDLDKLERHKEHFEKIFKNIDKEYAEARLELEIKKEFDPYQFTKDHPVIQRILGIYKKLKIKPTLEPTGGGSDVNIFNSHGLEVVCVGTGVYDMHTTRETLNIKEFVQAAEFCYALIQGEKYHG